MKDKMKNLPPRPARKDVALLAIEKFTKENNLEWGSAVASSIANSSATDGFDLIMELNRDGWDLTRDDLDLMDELVGCIDAAHLDQQVKWVTDNDIHSIALPIGTKVKFRRFVGHGDFVVDGVIDRVCDHGAAMYCIKTDDCRPNEWRVVRFEDVEVASDYWE